MKSLIDKEIDQQSPIMSEVFEYLGVSWSIQFANGSREMILPILSDYFLPGTTTAEKEFSLRLVADSYSGVQEIIESGRRVLILNSKKPTARQYGRYYDNGLTRTVFNSITASTYFLNYLSREITIYNKDIQVLSRDALQVIRALVKACVERKNSAAMCHAAGLMSKDGKGLIMLGPKGAGKTTLSLKLIYDHGFREVSRDRLFLVNQDDMIEVHGWPSYYNLTARTIRTFAQTEKHFPAKFSSLSDEEIENINEKTLFLPQEIGINNRERSCHLTHVFFLINRKKKSSLSPAELMAQNCFSPYDPNYQDWHRWCGDDAFVYSNAVNIANNVLNFQSTHVLEWDDIDSGAKEIVRLVES